MLMPCVIVLRLNGGVDVTPPAVDGGCSGEKNRFTE